MGKVIIMKAFLKLYLYCLPLGLGIVFALISIAIIVNIADGGEGQHFEAILFGVAGFPMIIASSIALVRKFEGQ